VRGVSALELEVSEHVRGLLKHYYDFELMDPDAIKREVKRLSREWPCLSWIAEEHRVLSLREVEEGLYVLLELDNMGFVLFLPRLPKRYDPYEIMVELETVQLSDEDIVYSDGIAQCYEVIDEDFDPEEHDRKVDEELDEWERYREVIRIGRLEVTKEGVVRDVECYCNIPHYHYFKDTKYVFRTNLMGLWALLRIAPLITYFV